MDNKKERKKERKYGCELCDLYTSDKTKFAKHCQTIKHKLSLEDNKWITKKTKKEKTENAKHLCKCGKSYAFQSGLIKHKKKCNSLETDKPNIKNLIQQNAELIEIIKQNAQPQIQNIQIQNQIQNQTFNIQIFLNEKCKDAISLTDFIESIQPSLKDLEKVGRVGYVQGISSIILSKLNMLDIYSRPIHCSDLKRETLYVKDICWEKDDKKVDKMVKTVVRKNMININEWKTLHPKYDDIKSSENTEYLKLLKECVGDTTRIMKNISKNVLLS